MHLDLSLISQLSAQEPKSLTEMCLKLAEEHGELAQEILMHHNASGVQHKTKNPQGIAEESVDVLLCAISIFFKNGGDCDQLRSLVEKKCQRWQKYQLGPSP